jgi:hypothetical protein
MSSARDSSPHPLRPGRQPSLGISHLPQLGGQAGRYRVHPGLSRDRKAIVKPSGTQNVPFWVYSSRKPDHRITVHIGSARVLLELD